MSFSTFIVTGDYAALAPGSVVNGTVTFTPNLGPGSVAHGIDSINIGIIKGVVHASIVNGILTPTSSFSPNVTLYSSDPNLHLNGALQYTVDFSNVTVDGVPAAVDSFVFNAPIGSTPIDLITVTPGYPLQITPFSYIRASQISDAGAFGIQLIEAATQAAAQTLIGTSGHTITVVTYSGSLSTARPTADAVYWANFPSTPTNALSQDIIESAADAALAATIHAATSKTTPVDADELPMVDSAASNVLKRLTFANLRAWVKGFATSKDSLTYNVLDHGVVADGATSNTTALAALVTTVVAAGGGTILFPPNTSSNAYVGSLVVNANVPIKVSGYGATLLGPSGGTTVTINTGVTGASGQTVAIEGLVIKGNADQSTDGVLVRDTSRASLLNCQIVRVNNGVKIQNATSSQNSEATAIRSTLISDCITGVRFDITSGGTSFDESLLDDTEISNCTTGIYLPTGADLVRVRLDATVWVGRTSSTNGVALYTDANMTRLWGRLGGEKYAGATSCTGVLVGPNASAFDACDLQLHLQGSISPTVDVSTSGGAGKVAMWREGLTNLGQSNGTPNANVVGPHVKSLGDTFPRSGFSIGSPANAPMPGGRDGLFFGSGSAQADTTLWREQAHVLEQGYLDSFKTGQNSTANRPNAVTVGQGAQFFDTTLNRPIWSNGASWNDLAVPGLTSTATAAGTTVLTVTSTAIQVFTGSTTQIVTLPTTGIAASQPYTIINLSTGVVTVNASGGTLVTTLASNTNSTITALQATPTTNAHWSNVGFDRPKLVSEFAGITSLASQAFPTLGGKAPTGVTIDVMIGPGVGGASGRRGAAGTIRGGGGGASAAAVLRGFYIPASLFGASWNLTIPAAGAGGAAVTTNDTNGNNGNSSGTTSFSTGTVNIIASPGDVGQGGTNTGSATPGFGGGTAGATGVLGAASSATGGPGVSSGPTFGGPSGPAAGSSGGGITSADVAGAGAAGGYNPFLGAAAGGSAGVVGGAVPGVIAAIAGFPGDGAGSGAASITTTAQTGGAGTGYGVGGSGGGASLNGNNSGAGGAGGPGFIRLVWDFS